MSNEEEVIEVIRCADDAGNTYSIYMIQEYIDTTSINFGRSRTPGLRRLEMENGSKVNYLNENTFKIVRNGRIIRRL